MQFTDVVLKHCLPEFTSHNPNLQQQMGFLLVGFGFLSI